MLPRSKEHAERVTGMRSNSLYEHLHINLENGARRGDLEVAEHSGVQHTKNTDHLAVKDNVGAAAREERGVCGRHNPVPERTQHTKGVSDHDETIGRQIRVKRDSVYIHNQ